MERNVKLAVATYKRQDYAEAILKHFGFDKYTNILYGADHNNKLKKVDIIEKCMVDLGVTDYSNAVMIGDRIDNDIVPAKQLGMKTIWVKQGFGSLWNITDESEKADMEINNLSDVLKYL